MAQHCASFCFCWLLCKQLWYFNFSYFQLQNDNFDKGWQWHPYSCCHTVSINLMLCSKPPPTVEASTVAVAAVPEKVHQVWFATINTWNFVGSSLKNHCNNSIQNAVGLFRGAIHTQHSTFSVRFVSRGMGVRVTNAKKNKAEYFRRWHSDRGWNFLRVYKTSPGTLW